MKFILKNSGENIINLIRKVGYHFLKEEKESEFAFIRPLERSGYPRFHLYLKINKKMNELIFNLHLDQKKPIYKGTPAHAGEYEGAVVENEAKRIKQILEQKN